MTEAGWASKLIAILIASIASLLLSIVDF